ncbi:MAG: GrpB family protein [Hyphomicrobiaceae bacterium]
MSEEQIFTLVDTEQARAAALALFDSLMPLLTSRLPPSADIRHIGATAVPGCLTKGDLDIVVRVPPEDFSAAEAALSKLFARNVGSARTHDFSAFEDASRNPPLGIQLTAIGGEFDSFHHFVEALLASPQLVAAYNALKRDWNGAGMADYRKAKDEFVARVLERKAP